MNLCGDCKVCCILFEIDKKYLSWRNSNKKEYEPCDKLCDKGCSIYLERPEPCKKYECFWFKQFKKTNMNFPEAYRPDKIGIVISIILYFINEEETIVFQIQETRKKSFDLENSLIRELLDHIFFTIDQLKKNGENAIAVIGKLGKGKAHLLKRD